MPGLRPFLSRGALRGSSGLPPPTISSVSPDPVSSATGANPFNVFGTGFVNGGTIQLDFGSVLAFTFVSSTQVQGVVSPGASQGSFKQVKIVNPDGQTLQSYLLNVVA
jgi:hypothetical protein